MGGQLQLRGVPSLLSLGLSDAYGIKRGVRVPYFGGPYAIFSVEIPGFLREFYAVRTPIVCQRLKNCQYQY